jgi:DDE superfamily endonuclease
VADRPFYSGKHRKHGMNLQVTSTPDGDIVWASRPLPGAVHDLTAARIWGIVRELASCGLVILADKGYAGAGSRRGLAARQRRQPRRPGLRPLLPGPQAGRLTRRHGVTIGGC